MVNRQEAGGVVNVVHESRNLYNRLRFLQRLQVKLQGILLLGGYVTIGSTVEFPKSLKTIRYNSVRRVTQNESLPSTMTSPITSKETAALIPLVHLRSSVNRTAFMKKL